MAEMIETPRWFYETYEGSQEDMARDIYESILARNLSEMQQNGKLTTKGRDITSIDDVEVASRLEAEAMMAAGARTHSLRREMEQASIILFSKIYQRNLHMIGRNEYSTFEEYLIDRIPGLADDSGELSNIMFMIQKMLPLLKQFGWDEKELMKFKDTFSKTQAATPTVRKLYRDFETSTNQVDEKIKDTEDDIKKLGRKLELLKPETPKYIKSYEELVSTSKDLEHLKSIKEDVLEQAGRMFSKGVEEVLKVVTNPMIPTEGLHGVRHVLKKNIDDTPFTIDGLRAEGPDGESIFMIRVPARWGSLIESALRTIVRWKVQDPKIIYEELRRSLFPKDQTMLTEKEILFNQTLENMRFLQVGENTIIEEES